VQNRLKLHYLRVWDAFNFQNGFRVNVAFLDGFPHAVLAYHVHYRRVLNHADRFLHGDFSAIVKLVLYVENNFSLPQSSSQQFAVANGEKHVSSDFLEVNVNVQPIALSELFNRGPRTARVANQKG